MIEADALAAHEWFASALLACEGSSILFERARTLLCQGEWLRRARQPDPRYRELGVRSRAELIRVLLAHDASG